MPERALAYSRQECTLDPVKGCLYKILTITESPDIMFQLILLSLVNLIVLMLGTIMSIYSPKKTSSKRWYIAAFWILGLSGFVLGLWQYKIQERKESEYEKKLDLIPIGIAASERARESEDRIAAAIATNANVALEKFKQRIAYETKERQDVEIINTGRTNDFDWDATRKEYRHRREEFRLGAEQARLEAHLAEAIQQTTQEADRQNEEQRRLQREQVTIDACYPYFERAITQLKNMLVDWVRKTQGGTNLHWRCPDLKKLIVPNGRCEIDLGEKSPWTLEISFADLKPENPVQKVRIVCMDRNPDRQESQKQVTPGGGGLTYTISAEVRVSYQHSLLGGSVHVSSKTSGESTPFHMNQESLHNYENICDAVLRTLLAALDEEMRTKQIKN